ncbi:MAG: class I SAM-dependent methyltransferase [Candidatus Omnitrophica bacterium]|nr:class I SAM-dependent methyltransferase [Candidatus Omnitrophota bacterium]
MPEHVLIKHCQICQGPTQEALSLGDLPLVDCLMEPSDVHAPVARYPANLQHCPSCRLAQLGCIVDNRLRFPPEYPYTSATTKILRDNFSQLALETGEFTALNTDDLVLDIGCNDGTLLKNFKDRTKVLGVTPEDMGQAALQQGIDVIQAYFTPAARQEILRRHGQATVVLAANVLAHFDDINRAVDDIKQLLKPHGLFISESGYLFDMLEGLQYDSIHHEHLRYYSLASLKVLFDRHGLQIIHAAKINTHGGSLRVYAAFQGKYPVRSSVAAILKEEADKNLIFLLDDFHRRAGEHKSCLSRLLRGLKSRHKTIQGIGAPGRATVLMNYAGIDNAILDGVAEIEGSHKIGKIIPGTGVRIVLQQEFFKNQPDYALMLSWHIAGELMPKLKMQGFRGDFILPLPKPVLISSQDAG